MTGEKPLASPPEPPAKRMTRWRAFLFRLLQRNERSPAEYLGIPPDRVVEVETRVKM